MKILKEDKLIVSYTNYNGLLFYAFEYFLDLRKVGYKLIFLKNKLSEKQVKKLFKAKYINTKEVKEAINKLIFLNSKQTIISNTMIIFSISVFNDLYEKTLFSKKLFLNYGNFHKRNNFIEKNKKIITFGDSGIDLKIGILHTLQINFKYFKKISNFKNSIYYEEKKGGTINENSILIRNFNNFHTEFNMLYFVRNNFTDKAMLEYLKTEFQEYDPVKINIPASGKMPVHTLAPFETPEAGVDFDRDDPTPANVTNSQNISMINQQLDNHLINKALDL